MDILKAVRDHYRGLWGEPSRKASFSTAEHEAEVYKWSAEQTSEGVNLYATIGASREPMPGEDQTHRVEFFLGLLPARDEVASPLAGLALFTSREGEALDHGHTVPAEGPLWPGTKMNRFLVMRPITEIIAPLKLPNGLHVEFLQAIPLFEEEFRYKAANGAEELIRLWERQGVRFWDPDRRSAVT
jgi:hypothetical protein